MALTAVTTELRVHVFGGVSAVAGGMLAELGGPRPRSIFARLAWESGRVVTVDQLVDDVWGEHPPARVRAAVQVHVSHLRAALGAIGGRDTIATRGAGYVLQLPPASVDVLEFAELVGALRGDSPWSTPDVETARRALLMWNGRPFAGLESPPFVDPIVAWLERRRTDLVAAAGAGIRSPDDAQRLLPIVERIGVSRPLDELLWAGWAQLLATAGERRGALNRLAELRTNLREHTGLEPGVRIDAVERRIFDADPPPLHADVTATSSVPPGRRAAERAAIDVALADAELVTVCGPIGVAAAAVVHDLEHLGWSVRTVIASDDAPERPHWVTQDCVAVTDAEKELVLLRTEDVRSETVLAAAAAVRARWSGRLVVAGTSPLGLGDEQVVRIDPMPLRDAVATLDELVTARRGRAPDASERELLGRIAAATGGLDTALEVAGERLARRRADRVLVEMDTTAGFLAGPVSRALSGLPTSALQIVHTLSTLQDWFDATDAQRVLPRRRPLLSEVETAIEQLLDVGLLEFDPARPEPYRVPRPTALAVREHLGGLDADEIAVLARVLAARSIVAASQIGTEREADGVAWFGRRREGLERLAAHPDAALVHRRAITRCLIHTSLATGRVDVARRLLTSTRHGSRLGRRDFLALATVANASDEYAVVDECVALAGTPLPGDQIGLELLFRHVRSLRHRCEFDAAHRGLAIVTDLVRPGTVGSANADLELGMTLAMEARTQDARTALGRARHWFELHEIERAVGACWVYEAWCDLAEGRPRRVGPALARSRAVAASLGHLADVAFTDVLLARLRLLEGDPDGASTLATSALTYLRAANDRLCTARALEVLADTDAIVAGDSRADAAAEAEWLRSQIGAPRSPLERTVAAVTFRS